MRPAYACSLLVVESPAQLVPEAELIVLGSVVSVDGEAAVLRPEAFLKGPASGADIRLERDRAGCPFAPLEAEERAIVFIYQADQPVFPYSNQAYVLEDGLAKIEGSEDTLTEAEVVSEIRAITAQYIVPAASEDEGAGIDWSNTILPVGVALLIVFGIGLVLMRTWHRIDPS